MGAGSLFVVLFTAKQWMWHVVSHQVRDIREDEHDKAVKVLMRAHEGSQVFALKALTAAQREVLKSNLERREGLPAQPESK
jgi:lipoate synthase